MLKKISLFSLVLLLVCSCFVSLAVDVTNIVPDTYTVGTIAVDEKYYIDRDYVVITLPDELADATMIMTGNNEKNGTGEGFITFDLMEPATVYIAHDSRGEEAKGGVPPEWLVNDFTFVEGMEIEVSDSNMGTFNLWKKDFDAGAVSLNGNADPPAAGQGSMYLILLVPLDLAAVEPTEKAATTWAEIKK